ncbi:trihelix transcription factor GTL2-like [Carica papaya]|uniref:trihelix transcription factor GTL2-like n=1 Tax=Carica papaya TaxID=3649 RepID=UPI000B8C9447|nr:trihelix transcription factor GTL2-like [Carica papaya]
MVVGLDLEMEGGIITSNIPTDHHHHHHHHHQLGDQDHQPWSSDEVLALLRIRSSMENWFPEFSWEHVSRKFAELGFKRSAEKCKEKFEEESSYFNNINHNQNNYTKINGSYRVFSDDLEELYTEHDDHVDDDNHQHVVNVERNETVEEKPSEEEDKSPRQDNLNDNYKDQDDQTAEIKINPSGIDDDIKSRKRKREEEQKKKKIKEEEFEMFKGFCEEIVKNMMIQQEEMHNKLLEDMVKRDEEKVAREEIWKKKEIERINEELELRAQEQAISGDRQSAIINFRISQGMLELGYKRSAKRCKEKWENINKYFRKTRDVNKKRSIDSRTCPYFHQLSTLYNQGTLVVPSPSGGGSEDLPTLRQKNSDSPETLPPVTWQDDSNVHPILHVPQSEKSVVQIPSYDFDF